MLFALIFFVFWMVVGAFLAIHVSVLFGDLGLDWMVMAAFLAIRVSVLFGDLGFGWMIMTAFLAIRVSVLFGDFGFCWMVVAAFLAIRVSMLFWFMVTRTFFTIRMHVLFWCMMVMRTLLSIFVDVFSLLRIMVVIATTLTMVVNMIVIVTSWSVIVSATLTRSMSMVVQVFWVQNAHLYEIENQTKPWNLKHCQPIDLFIPKESLSCLNTQPYWNSPNKQNWNNCADNLRSVISKAVLTVAVLFRNFQSYDWNSDSQRIRCQMGCIGHNCNGVGVNPPHNLYTYKQNCYKHDAYQLPHCLLVCLLVSKFFLFKERQLLYQIFFNHDLTWSEGWLLINSVDE